MDRRTQRVLLVDDNADITATLGWGLEHLGYAVRTASDGLAGLEAAIEFRPHAAVIDLSMPVLDGWALAARLRELVTPPRLIALTGLSSHQHRARSARSGFDHHLVKPISLARIDALLTA